MDLKKVSNVLESPGCKEKYRKLIQMQLEETQISDVRSPNIWRARHRADRLV